RRGRIPRARARRRSCQWWVLQWSGRSQRGIGEGETQVDKLDEDETVGTAVNHDEDLGVAAQILMEDGRQQAAALLLDVADLRYEWNGHDEFNAVVIVPPWLVERFTDEIQEQILDALREATRDTER